MKKTVAIVLSGGKGTRMNSDIPKQYIEVCGRPILFYTLKTFEESSVDSIVLVCAEADKDFCRKEIVEKYGFKKVECIVAGGRERYHSVYNGLKSVPDAEYVLIHDGARPFVTVDIIERNIENLKDNPAVVTGMPSKDTVKIADDEGFVSFTPNRSNVWNIQTPQSFDYKTITDAYDKMFECEDTLKERGISITDDALVAENFSKVKLKLVEGSYTNIKITTPDDMLLAEKILGKIWTE